MKVNLIFSSLILILYQVFWAFAETPNDDVYHANTTLLSVYNTTKLLRETIDTLETSIDVLKNTDHLCN